MSLTPQREAFAAALAQGMTQAAAYRIAYPKSLKWKDETVWRKASLMAAKGEVQARVTELVHKAADANEVTIERVVKEFARLAFSSPRAMFNEDGSPKQITDLPDAEASALAGFEVLEQFEGSGQDRVFVGYLKKFKLSDRKGYLDMLMKHLGGYEQDNKQKVDPLTDLLAMVSRSSVPVAKTPAPDDDD